jgi:hypothetical protein
MAGTPKQSGIYAGSMTVRGKNLQNSLGNVDISGLYNSTSDPRGVLTADAQTNDYIYGNVSAAGGFDQSEVDFVTNLINSGQVSVADVAKQFGLPESIISAAYEANRPAVEPAAIERLTQNQPAPAALSPADTATISSPSLPDATYTIPGFSLPDYRYNDTSSSSGSSSGGAGGSLTNYVTAVEPARSGPEGYTGPSISALPPGGGLGPGEYSLGNTTLDRGIGGGGSFVDGNSSTFVQDLIDQDAREERADVDYLNYLAGIQAQEDKAKLLAGAASPEGGFDEGEIEAVRALVRSNAVTINDVANQFNLPIELVAATYDALPATKDEYLGDIAAAIKNEGIVTENLQATTADRAGALDPNFTASQAAIASGVGGLTTAKQNTKDAIDAALASGVVDQGDIDDAFGPTFAETALEGVSNVLGAGTRGIYNVASNIPVVGGYLEDAIEGFAGWLKNTEGTVSANPITRQVSGVWGEIPPWVKTEALTKIGPIPNSKTTAGINSGTIIDDIISIGRGERDIGDVLEDRAEQAASILGIDPKILAAAAAAGMSVKDYLEAQKPKQTTLGTTTEGETEAGVKPVAVDLGGGPNKEGGEEEDIVDTLTEAQEKEKNLATATQVFEDAGGVRKGYKQF